MITYFKPLLRPFTRQRTYPFFLFQWKLLESRPGACFCSSSGGAECAVPVQATKKKKSGKKGKGSDNQNKISSRNSDSVDVLNSVVRWLTTPSSSSLEDDQVTLPPSVSTHFTFKNNSKKLSIQTQDHTSVQLTPQQTLSASRRLLAALSSPESSSTSPLHILDSTTDNLNTSNLLRSLPQAHKLIVEFSSPNIAKPLHMGHLRSTITGSFVRNIAEFAGHEVESVCFLGDWGRQFGVLRGGVEEELRKSQDQGASSPATDFSTFIESLSLHDLLNIYVKASNRMESGDEEFKNLAMKYSSELEESFGNENSTDQGYLLWKHTRALTVQHLKSCYKSLNVNFDVYEGESEFRLGSAYTDKALRLMESNGLSEKWEDGTLRLTGKEGNNVLIKRDGSSVYLLRDIGAALRRLERSGQDDQNKVEDNPNGQKYDRNSRRFVYVVDSGQSEHFKNLFEVLRGLGVSEREETKNETTLPFSSTHTHIPFNRVVGMSTRSGNFVLLSQVISEGTTLMHETRAKSKNARNIHDLSVSEQLAVSGLIVNSLKMRRGKSYDFDWSEALRSSGNSGVSLQYTVMRLRSLFRKVREIVGVDGGLDSSFSYVGEREIGEVFGRKDTNSLVELVVCLMNFEDTFWKSYTQLEPCLIVAYAFNLSDKISRVLSSIRILDGSDRELADAALWVLGISERVLVGCLNVIGVKVVEGEGF